MNDNYPTTPDGRYFVVKGRLWRLSDPSLNPQKRERLVKELMRARRDVKAAKDADDLAAEQEAHQSVDEAKRALGERGPVWWSDGAIDYTRHAVKNSPYADWYKSIKASG